MAPQSTGVDLLGEDAKESLGTLFEEKHLYQDITIGPERTARGKRKTVLIKGGSVIVSPLGEMLAGPLRGAEGVLVAEVDEKDVIRGKYDLDVVGHYARPDVFHLSVDERAKPAVSYATPTTSSQELKPWTANQDQELHDSSTRSTEANTEGAKTVDATDPRPSEDQRGGPAASK